MSERSIPWLVYAGWLFSGGSAALTAGLCLYWGAQSLSRKLGPYLDKRRRAKGGEKR